jgi:hypothetical protein
MPWQRAGPGATPERADAGFPYGGLGPMKYKIQVGKPMCPGRGLGTRLRLKPLHTILNWHSTHATRGKRRRVVAFEGGLSESRTARDDFCVKIEN